MSNRIYFPHLDVIRFFSALLIVVLHAYLCYNGWFGKIGLLTNTENQEFTFFGNLIHRLIQNFHFGVDIFFLISGFLITYILVEEKKQFGKIDIRKFMIRRSLRIWPLYFLLIAITPFLIKWLDEPVPTNYISTLFFVNNFHTLQTGEWSYPFAHFWSICIEEHFYLFWPFVVSLLPQKKMLYVFISIILLSISYQVYLSFYDPNANLALYLNTFCRIDVMVIGAIGGLLYSNKPFNFNFKPILNIALFVGIFIYLSFDPLLYWKNPISPILNKYITVLTFAILLLNYNFNSSFKFRIPEKSFIHYFGKISYGIYMISNILLPIVVKKIMWVLESSNIFIFSFFVLTLSILIPILSYEIFEKRFQKWGSKFRVVKIER